jgi:hypothetical protein
MKPKSKNALLLHAHAMAQGIAVEAGIMESDHWPWRFGMEPVGADTWAIDAPDFACSGHRDQHIRDRHWTSDLVPTTLCQQDTTCRVRPWATNLRNRALNPGL